MSDEAASQSCRSPRTASRRRCVVHSSTKLQRRASTRDVTKALCTAAASRRGLMAISAAPMVGIRIVASGDSASNPRIVFSDELFPGGRHGRPDEQRNHQHHHSPHHRQRVKLHHAGLQQRNWPPPPAECGRPGSLAHRSRCGRTRRSAARGAPAETRTRRCRSDR